MSQRESFFDDNLTITSAKIRKTPAAMDPTAKIQLPVDGPKAASVPSGSRCADIL